MLCILLISTSFFGCHEASLTELTIGRLFISDVDDDMVPEVFLSVLQLRKLDMHVWSVADMDTLKGVDEVVCSQRMLGSLYVLSR